MLNVFKLRSLPLLLTCLLGLLDYITSVIKVRSPKELAQKFRSECFKK